MAAQVPSPLASPLDPRRHKAHGASPGVCHQAASPSLLVRQEKKCDRGRNAEGPRKFS